MISHHDIVNLITSSCKIIPILTRPEELNDIHYPYSMIEIVHRTNQTKKTLSVLANNSSVLSVGTILSTKDVDMCSEFQVPIVFSPHLDIDLVKYCTQKHIVMIPGVSTATEIMSAYKAGINIVKFFPCHSKDKIQELIQYSKVFQHLKLFFIVTGGITKDNYKEILNIPNVIGVGSSTIKNIDTSINE